MIPTHVQINHDLKLLYTIARTQLPKEILEGLLYGEDFEDPKEEDVLGMQEIIKANRRKEYKDILEFWRI